MTAFPLKRAGLVFPSYLVWPGGQARRAFAAAFLRARLSSGTVSSLIEADYGGRLDCGGRFQGLAVDLGRQRLLIGRQDRRKRERRDKEHQRHGHGAFTLRRITENLKNPRPGKPTTKAACVQEGRCHHRPYRKRGYHVVIQLDFAFRIRQRAKRTL